MMKFAVLFLFATVALAERPRRFLLDSCQSSGDCGEGKCCALGKYCLPKLIVKEYFPCSHTEYSDCSECADGLQCKVFKEYEVFGKKIQLKACMRPSEEVVDRELNEQTEMMERRSIIDKIPKPTLCAQESECGANQCCLFSKICAPKLFKYAPCNLQNHHKCGCGAGLTCQAKEWVVFGKKIVFHFCLPEPTDA